MSLLGSLTLRQLRNQRFAKNRNIVGLATGNQIAVLNNFLVNPRATCIADIVLQTRPACYRTPLDDPLLFGNSTKDPCTIRAAGCSAQDIPTGARFCIKLFPFFG
jgi:hypothetical protein